MLTIKRQKTLYLLAIIIIITFGAFLRFTGINWDQGHLLHPDERFLTMVATDIEMVISIDNYFNTAESTLNPHNVGYHFYVYGTFPLFLVRCLAELFGQPSLEKINLIGRLLSGIFDLSSIIVLYLLGKRLFGALVGLSAAFLSCLAVLQIQLSHFFIVDTFGNFFVILAIYFAVSATLVFGNNNQPGNSSNHLNNAIHFTEQKKHILLISACGASAGAAAACKINLGFVALIIPVAIFLFYKNLPAYKHRYLDATTALAFAAIASFLMFRILQPYAFSGPGLLGLGINEYWLQNFVELQSISDPSSGFPPSLQWHDRPPWFALQNMVLWGLGPFLGISSWAGFLFAGKIMIKQKAYTYLMPWGWGLLFFIWQSLSTLSTMRYFLPIYPLIILYSVAALFYFFNKTLFSQHPFPKSNKDIKLSHLLIIYIATTLTMGTLLWAFAFTEIYRNPHSRIEASRWIYENIPSGSTIALESLWDDPLPLNLKNYENHYNTLYLNLYHPDTPEKEKHLQKVLTEADYIIKTSNRLWGSIPRLPELYPITTRYYQQLLGCPDPNKIVNCYINASVGPQKGDLGFSLIQVIRSDPSIGPFSINDQFAEEAFTVYDHPMILIFGRETIN